MILSEANNLWNKIALESAQKARIRERASKMDRIIYLSTLHPSEIENSNDFSFEEFYQSRLAGIVARNRADYSLKRASHTLLKPFYHIQWSAYQISEVFKAASV